MFKTIIVPTDGSKFAEKAEDVAISITKNFNGKLVVLHIIDEKLIYPYEVLEEEGKNILKNASKKAEEQDITADTVLIVGDPTHDMSKIVEKIGADLVVIGTHGKAGLKKFLMGSVAENVIKTVEVPVLLVK
jgi:nucleotide-binding universal stress UspA family protein